MPFSRRSTCPPATPAVVFTGALLSITIGAGFYLATAEAIESDAEERFRGMARATQYAIDARIKSYTDVLRGAAGLFHARPDTSDGEFRAYVEQLDTPRNFPGIVALNYARSVGPGALAALDAELRERLRAAGMPAPARGLVPVPGRAKHTVIVRIEPANPHTLAKLGTDLEENGHLRRLLYASRDGNTITTSGIRVSGFGRYDQGGTVLGMRLPVYRGGMPADTLARRRAAYLGSVGINFGVDRMVGGVLEGFPVKGVRLVLTDVEAPPMAPGEAPPSPVLYDSQAGAAPPAAAPASDGDGVLHASLPVRFNQREWRADFSIERSA
ncbi:CHASE domain-containing protein, partial [Massilia sp. MS-15]|uniref:CHASE domain-containing protein n=1 Tax=Massilia sp. MS-15 TaxID=2878200 RepID=UPI001CD43004